MPDTMTAYIKEDLKARLRTDTRLSLTLAALSGHYRVSFTPVRLAMKELIDERVLTRQANGRMEVNVAALGRVQQPAAVPERPDDAAAIDAAITAEIIRVSLAGQDDALREEATAARLGIGRTVLRQGLNRLAGKGLVEHLPRRGWRVRPFDEAEMAAYLQVRESLELKALELAQPHLVRADLQRMLHGNRPLPGGTGARLDNDLHRYLIEKAGNRYIREFFEHHGLYYAALFDFAAPEANVVRAMARQHRGILRALLADDWPGARKALARHIRAQRPIVRRLLQQLANRSGANP